MPTEVAPVSSGAASSYGLVARSLHWITAALILAAWAFIEFKGIFPKGSPGRQLLVALHNQLGLLALLLIAIRLPWNLAFPVASAQTPAPQWTQWAANWVKRLLYVLVIAASLSGIAAAQARGNTVSLLGWALPDLLGTFSGLRKVFEEVHESLANALLAVAGAHTAAALWHHFVLHDGILSRMLGRPHAPAR